jgi:transcriptional regulator with XRE-family HTH domain
MDLDNELESDCRDTGSKTALKESIGLRFRKMREYAQLSQKETGRIFGMHQTTIARIEKGIVSPNFTICDYFHTHYNINMNWLITGEGEMVAGDENIEPEPAEYGEFSEAMKDLLFHLDHVPTARYAILKFFMGYKLENKKNILKYLHDNNLKKE